MHTSADADAAPLANWSSGLPCKPAAQQHRRPCRTATSLPPLRTGARQSRHGAAAPPPAPTTQMVTRISADEPRRPACTPCGMAQHKPDRRRHMASGLLSCRQGRNAPVWPPGKASKQANKQARGPNLDADGPAQHRLAVRAQRLGQVILQCSQLERAGKVGRGPLHACQWPITHRMHSATTAPMAWRAPRPTSPLSSTPRSAPHLAAKLHKAGLGLAGVAVPRDDDVHNLRPPWERKGA